VSPKSVLGPGLFNIFTTSFAKYLLRYGAHHRLYVSDAQLYIIFPPTDHVKGLVGMKACLRDINIWLCDNGLVFIRANMQIIATKSLTLSTPITLTDVDVCGQLVPTSAVI
jgi:hypothetical protein